MTTYPLSSESMRQFPAGHVNLFGSYGVASKQAIQFLGQHAIVQVDPSRQAEADVCEVYTNVCIAPTRELLSPDDKHCCRVALPIRRKPHVRRVPAAETELTAKLGSMPFVS